ncbi:MAG: hypothetical protein K0R05_3644 [Anaerocolumna sp.]|jgi:hypothetical protein|nr:hypothetical protein [Anaerocolumna sp.]
MKTKSNYEVNQITATIEEAYQKAYQTLTSNHRNLSAKALSYEQSLLCRLIEILDDLIQLIILRGAGKNK